MKFFIMIIISLFFYQKISSQTISARELKKTKWFTDNRDNLFFKKNQIKLIKYNNLLRKEKHNANYVESKYYSDLESIQLDFDRNCVLKFISKNYHMGSISLKKWKLKKNKLMILDKNGQSKYIFKIDSFKDVEFESEGKSYITQELILSKD